ncbi:MAG TPA: hypothetical protein VFV34_00725 [Blastocatellia bacterium]|nr:hypothetical protein [Blastocatellia bacterium]
MTCGKIRSLIDESDRPDRLAPSVLSHTALCSECRVFAEDRARLSELLLSVGRVNAPPNFDAMLRMRLADQTAKPRLQLSPAMFFRFGGAVAAMVLVAAGVVYVTRDRGKARDQAPTAAINAGTDVKPSPPSGDRSIAHLPGTSANPGILEVGPTRNASSPTHKRLAAMSSSQANVGDSLDPAPVFWLRTDEMEVGVPVVSVGAQSLYYSTAGQPNVRTVKTSF